MIKKTSLTFFLTFFSALLPACTYYQETFDTQRAQVWQPQINMPGSVVVCRSKQCAPTNLSMSREYIYNSLLHLLDSNTQDRALVCTADSASHVCTENYLALPIVVGVTPAHMYIDSVKITDVSARLGQKSLNLVLNYNVTYNGQSPTCKPAQTLLYVKNAENIVMEDAGYSCKMTTIGNTTIKTLFAIDYIDLDYGYIGGYYSIGLSGPAYGGGSGYMMLRFPNDAYPLSEGVMAQENREEEAKIKRAIEEAFKKAAEEEAAAKAAQEQAAREEAARQAAEEAKIKQAIDDAFRKALEEAEAIKAAQAEAARVDAEEAARKAAEEAARQAEIQQAVDQALKKAAEEAALKAAQEQAAQQGELVPCADNPNSKCRMMKNASDKRRGKGVVSQDGVVLDASSADDYYENVQVFPLAPRKPKEPRKKTNSKKTITKMQETTAVKTNIPQENADVEVKTVIETPAAETSTPAVQ